MGPLVTAAQAAASLVDFPADQDAQDALIADASAAVEGWCECGLGWGAYAEVHRPERTRTIRLRARPLARILRVAAGYRELLSIRCVDAAAMRATAEVAGGVLTLSAYRAGAPSPQALTLSDYATVGDLAAAVGAVAGWSAQTVGAYAGWLVADLAPPLGAMDAKAGAAGIGAYTRDLGRYVAHPASAAIELTEMHPATFRYPDRTWGNNFGFAGPCDPRLGDVSVSFQAGYDPTGLVAGAPPVPGDLRRGVILTIAAMAGLTPDAGLMDSETEGDWSAKRIQDASPVPPAARKLLYRYKRKSL